MLEIQYLNEYHRIESQIKIGKINLKRTGWIPRGPQKMA